MKLASIRLDGYRCFRSFHAPVDSLEVLVGANGAGKTALLEFLRWLREASQHGIPPEIVPGSSYRNIFHNPGPERFSWSLRFEDPQRSIDYEAQVLGPRGRVDVVYERASAIGAHESNPELTAFLEFKSGKGDVMDDGAGRTDGLTISSNRLALGAIVNSSYRNFYEVKRSIEGWRFYDAALINTERIRRPVPIEQEPLLREDAGNLTAVLNYMLTEFPDRFEQLQVHLRNVIPGFRRLTVKARGAPGEMLAFWLEDGADEALSLADLSDGTLRMLIWITLCLHPHPPSLVCIDEPEQGLHPRTLPLLGALIDGLSERTQVVVSTHSSYFLRQFSLERLAVMRKEQGASRWLKPASSNVLRMALEEFGPEELETMHHTDELEALS